MNSYRYPKYFTLVTLFVMLAISACTKTDTATHDLNLVLIGNIKGLDPALMNDTYAHKVGGHIYEPLLTYDYFQTKPELIPLLAESLPKISKDGLTYTFKIKKGTLFQDDDGFADKKGREVTAADFIYSWKRIADRSNVSENFWLIDGRIVGLNEWREALLAGKGKFDDSVSGLQAPDSQTLIIKLTRPDYQLNYALATVQLSAVPREIVEHYGKEFLNHPVGTGPYKLKDWVHNNQISLTRNPTFRDSFFPKGVSGMEVDGGKKLPLTDEIHFHEITEDQTRWLNFMKGNLDVSGIPKDDFDSAVDRKTKTVKGDLAKRGTQIVRQAQTNLLFRILNMEDPFLGKHKKVRQAMSLAEDRVTSFEKFYNGRATLATMPIPPAIDGFDSSFKNSLTQLNIEKAKQLLKEDGFPEGKGIPDFTYEATNSTTSRQEAEFFQRNMAQIGITIKVHLNTWPEMTEKVKTRKAQITSMAWVADYPDAENFYQLLYSKNVSPGSNGANYQNPAFDALYDKSLLRPQGPERNAIYLKMASIVADDVPWILIGYRDDFFLNQSWVRNYIPNDWASAGYQFVGVDSEKRVEDKRKL